MTTRERRPLGATEVKTQKEIADGFRHRTQVFVEGEISVNNYQDSNGQNQKSINIIQRAYPLTPPPP